MFRWIESHKEALEAVRGGADIYSRSLAQELREIEQEQEAPNRTRVIRICKPQMYKGDGTDCMPLFGCILTTDGEIGLKYVQERGTQNPTSDEVA